MNAYGKFIRELRKKKNETLLTMSQKLNVSIAFLSAIENGKKQIPSDYARKIKNAYNLSEEEYEQLEECIVLSNNKIEFNINSMDELHKDVSISFARKINTASQKTLEELREILNRKEK